VIGINTVKVSQKGANGIGFALSAADLIDVLHHYYPSSEVALEELSAPTDAAKSGSPSAAPKSDEEKFGSVYISGPGGAEVRVDHHPRGQTPETLRLSVGLHLIVVHDGTHADWMHWTKVSEGDKLTLVLLWPK
jgi:S1-C subfamily serine protease